MTLADLLAFVVLLGRIVAALAGGALVYVAALMRRTERDEVQNRILVLWYRIDSLTASGVRKHVAFARVAAEAVARMLDRIFGKPLLSLRFVVASYCYSVAGMCIVHGVRVFLTVRTLLQHGQAGWVGSYDDIVEPNRSAGWTMLYFGAAFVILGLFQISERRPIRLLGILLSLCASAWCFSLLELRVFSGINPVLIVPRVDYRLYFHLTEQSARELWNETLGRFVYVTFYGFLSDALFILAIRTILNRASTARTALAAVTLPMAALLVAVAIPGIPLALAIADDHSFLGWLRTAFAMDYPGLRLIAESNAIDVIISLLISLVAFTLWVHPLPLFLSRALERIAEETVVETHRKWVATVGILLIGFAIPGSVAVLKSLLP